MLRLFAPALVAGFLLATPALADVTCVQQGLVDLGFDPGPVDGALGKKTITAATLFAANAGLQLETLSKANSDAWCTAITEFAATPEAKTISHLDLVSEPDAILSERDTQRLWNAYKTARECMAHPTYGDGYSYKLPLHEPAALAARPWTSPFTNATGAPQCQVQPGALQTPKPIPTVVLDESYGERVESVDRAATWFRTMTNYYRYTHDPAVLTLLRNALLDWAGAGGLGKGIHVSWGKKPVDYQMIATILSFTAALAEIAPELTAEERAVIGPWMQDLLKQVANSNWGARADNKQYMRTYTAMLWGLIIGDDRPVQEAIFTFKRGIHDMRPDGSHPVDSQRGGMGLHYNSASTSHLVMIATALKRARNVDLFGYEVDGRSVHTAVDWVVHSMRDPVGANTQYAIACPGGGDRFGSIDTPNLNQFEEAGYLLAYAELFPDRESSAYIGEHFEGRRTPDEEKNGGTPSCHFTLQSGEVNLPRLELPAPPEGLLEPTIIVHAREEISHQNGANPDSNSFVIADIDDAKPGENTVRFNVQGTGFDRATGLYRQLQLVVHEPLGDSVPEAVAACAPETTTYDDMKVRLVIGFDRIESAYVAQKADCLLGALTGTPAFYARFLLTHFADIAVGMAVDGNLQRVQNNGLRAFLERVATGQVTVGK